MEDAVTKAKLKTFQNNEYLESEDLILEDDEWEPEEWQTILKVFNKGYPAARIVLKGWYNLQIYGIQR